MRSQLVLAIKHNYPSFSDNIGWSSMFASPLSCIYSLTLDGYYNFVFWMSDDNFECELLQGRPEREFHSTSTTRNS